MADVGDVYAYFPQLSFLLDTEGIVEVFGILGVDGAGPNIAEVLTTADFLRCDTRFYILCGILHSFWILVRQTILCENGVHLHIVVAFLSQYVDDLADDVL